MAALAADVHERLEAAIAEWGLPDPEPLPGGCVGLVCAAGDAVVKVSPRGHRDDYQLRHEGAALRFWQQTGVVARMLDERDDGFTLLLERLRPGLALDEIVRGWEQRLELLGELAVRLHEPTPSPGEFAPMTDFCDDWRAALAGEPDLLAELERLVEPAGDDVLVHADLHGGNVLRHGDGWRVIDPKGVRGDRHSEVWALLEPDAPAVDSPQVARGWLERYSRAAELDPERAGAWVRLRARAEAAMVGDAAWAARLRALAAALD